jgi:hypothetical protein
MVSVGFPETRTILFCKLDAINPFGALPEVKPGHNQPDRIAVIWRDNFSVVLDRKEHVLLEEVLQGDVVEKPLVHEL